MAKKASVAQGAITTGEATKVSAKQPPAEAVFSTGVAKGRDRLDSATSTSSLQADDIQKIGARSLAEILRSIPGIRTESSTGEANGSYTIRGLPLASGGSKFMQIQEDGLPVLEFGDFFNVASDIFIRADSNLSAVEAIRGGSASTFASNSPGGVINLISKTGEVEGGAIELTTGVDYDTKRLDFDYGGRISDTLRFHLGGFYRSGEGQRDVGFNAYQGGQLKFNITKEFDAGYIRLSGKYLDDRAPAYLPGPIRITGTDANPTFSSFTNFDIRRDSVQSRYITSFPTLDGKNQPISVPMSQGLSGRVKAVGLESQFDISDWTVTAKARYSKISGTTIRDLVANIYPGNGLPASLGAGTGTLTYANGPNAGQVITPADNINGNGLIAATSLSKIDVRSLDNFTSDIRATRVFDLGRGKFTLTGGVYKSLQDLTSDWLYSNITQDLHGGGNSALINYTNAAGVLQSQDGFLGFTRSGSTGFFRRTYDVQYDVTAPYGSINYHIGKISIGGSIRYDIGKVRGQLFGYDLGGGRVGTTSYDFNGDGVISVAESKTNIIPLTRPAPVNYDYHYLSYSTGINFRISEPLAVFARYSRGARANADKVLFSSKVSVTDGSMPDSADGADVVRQAEAGLKFRRPGLTFNITGFIAKTEDTNVQAGAITTDRRYRAHGAEVEAGIQRGPVSITGGLTYTDAEIVSDRLNKAVAGMVPRRQPKLIYQATTQYESGRMTVGAYVVGNTSSFAQDINALKIPGYVLVNPFVQYRPVERLEFMVNVNNVFDKVAIIEISQTSVPGNGVGWGRAANGRTISASARYAF
ncbi:TonB-dependent receptor domain-containing protein [Novosphingobium sp. Rr 2-17]|uniref:TonB-dependent receptor domain-containing protein n=1 Tax=Novosphingobium sp. Rr 2-17 TaxID=555793 RepID=UPI00063F9822|nr:TonB-dependent receptor [Novosphingobium sp. Rr 2-17]